jgi:hypothetical protein
LENDNKEKQKKFVKDNIVDAYSTEKINELHYNLLKEELSNYGKQ